MSSGHFLRAVRVAAALAAMTAVAATAALIVVLPAPVGAASVIAAAISWCVWLERHPEAPPTGAATTSSTRG